MEGVPSCGATNTSVGKGGHLFVMPFRPVFSFGPRLGVFPPQCAECHLRWFNGGVVFSVWILIFHGYQGGRVLAYLFSLYEV